MNDFSYPLVFVVAGLLGWFAGRVTRRFNYDMEAYDRAFGPDGHADADARTHGHGNSDLDGSGFYLAEYRDARRRTILRDHVGDRPGAGAPGGAVRGADEEAVT